MSRIGVLVCHCGHNIAGTVDVASVVAELRQHPKVAFAVDYKYMCSDPGQMLIKQAIAEHQLDGVVVAACSPAMHETTFRHAVAEAGLNPYRYESANIREQVSWVHQNQKEPATVKAMAVARSMVEKVATNETLEPIHAPVTQHALVIGGGVAGMRSALDIAEAGFPVILLERQAKLGGKMAQLSGTFLNFNASDLLQQMIHATCTHPNIQVITGVKSIQVDGYVGNFSVKVTTGQAGQFTFTVGGIIAATGWERYPQARLPEYGGGQIPDVIDGLAFEQILASGEPIRRPSDGKIAQEVVFVQCAGSRDPERGVPYCSKVCCMYVAKQAMLYKERVPNGQAYVFYIDIRSAGKGYDEYVQRAMSNFQVLYLRGKVSKIFTDGDKVLVWGVDTISGRSLEIAADLVVLATPMAPDPGAIELGQRLHISTDTNGFFTEAHAKLRPVETLTAGIFLAGTAQGPKDIPETVAQASAAAAKVLQLFSSDKMTLSPLVATVTAELCAGCGACVLACPYGARAIHPLWNIATVNASLCQNCGACVTACPNKASQVHNWRPDQILAMLDEVMD